MKERFPGFDETLDLVIVGGESGRRARACDLDWLRYIVEQCQHAGVAVFVKQLGDKPMLGGDLLPGEYSRKGGNINEWPIDLRVQDLPPQLLATVRQLQEA